MSVDIPKVRLALIALLLPACGSSPQTPDDPAGTDAPPAVDADGDGWYTPDDCDDADPAVHPGVAHDKPYDGLDADCAGDDEDVDGDGFLARAVGGDDCDDHDPLIPGDLDEDGFTCEEDCDESDPLVNAGAVPVCGDGYDNDCDGVMDCGLHGIHDIDDIADVTITGTTYGGGMGTQTDIGELTGDGVNDLLVYHSGKQMNYLHLYAGPLAPNSMEEDYASLLWAPQMYDHVVGDFNHDGQLDAMISSGSRAEYAQGHLWFGPIAPGEPEPDVHVLDYTTGLPTVFRCDVNHDGGDDVVFGWRDGPVYHEPVVQLIHGPITSDVPREQIAASLYSTDSGSDLGAVVRCGDFDADGMDDLIIGGYSSEPLRVVPGPDIPQSGDVPWDAVGAEVVPWSEWVSLPYDWNGDGYDDLGWVADGGISVNLGPLPEAERLALVLAAHNGPMEVSSSGDMDGDGMDDLLVTDSSFNGLIDWDIHTGALLVFLSPLSGTLTHEDAEAILADDTSGTLDTFDGMHQFAPPGDLNQDGYLDIVVASRGRDEVALNAGKVFILYGEQPGF